MPNMRKIDSMGKLLDKESGMGVHNISVPDDLWARIQQAAAKAGAERGKPMSVSEWLRSLVLEKLGGK